PDDTDPVSVGDADGDVVEEHAGAQDQTGPVERDQAGGRCCHQPCTGPSGPPRTGPGGGGDGVRWCWTTWAPGTGPTTRVMSPVGPLAARPTDRSIASAWDPTRKATVGP